MVDAICILTFMIDPIYAVMIDNGHVSIFTFMIDPIYTIMVNLIFIIYTLTIMIDHAGGNTV